MSLVDTVLLLGCSFLLSMLVSASGLVTNLSTTILDSPIAIAGLGNPDYARADISFLRPLIVLNWGGK